MKQLLTALALLALIGCGDENSAPIAQDDNTAGTGTDTGGQTASQVLTWDSKNWTSSNWQ